MSNEDQDVQKSTTLQLIRQAVRSRNLRRLTEAFERDWAQKFVGEHSSDLDSGKSALFDLALKEFPQAELRTAYAWTWDCYHPLMGPLGNSILRLRG